jgi:hypothetical protein
MMPEPSIRQPARGAHLSANCPPRASFAVVLRSADFETAHAALKAMGELLEMMGRR